LPPAFAALGASHADGEANSYDEICVARYPKIDHVEHVHHAGNSSGVVDGAAAR
jgi:acetyl-CoA C-acetyltransferase